MENPTYRHVISELSVFLGSPDYLSSGNGARFRHRSAFSPTVYHANLADGNSVETAFKPDSFAQIGCVCAITDHPTNTNQRFNWPRVGVQTNDEATQIIQELRTALA